MTMVTNTRTNLTVKVFLFTALQATVCTQEPAEKIRMESLLLGRDCAIHGLQNSSGTLGPTTPDAVV